jgi:hypothetical protein
MCIREAERVAGMAKEKDPAEIIETIAQSIRGASGGRAR